MTQSHTGDGDRRRLGLRRGVPPGAASTTASEVDELVDRLQFLEQLPPEKWSALRGLGVLTGTGGFATMTADLAEEESIDVPEIPELTRSGCRGSSRACAASNPLDATGVILANLDIWEQIVTTYAAQRRSSTR